MKEQYEKINYEEAFRDILELTDFELSKEHDGYALNDTTGTNLGNIESDRFENAVEIIDRLDNYINDSFFRDLEEEMESVVKADGIEMPETAKDWVNFLEKHEELKKDYYTDYKVMRYLSDNDTTVDLENLVDYVNSDVKIDAKAPLYYLSSYYDGNFSGLEADAQSYDWAKLEEMAHEKLMKGLSVEIYDRHSKGTIWIKADDYIKDWTDYDLAEFPYKPADLEKGKEINYKRINHESIER